MSSYRWSSQDSHACLNHSGGLYSQHGWELGLYFDRSMRMLWTLMIVASELWQFQNLKQQTSCDSVANYRTRRFPSRSNGQRLSVELKMRPTLSRLFLIASWNYAPATALLESPDGNFPLAAFLHTSTKHAGSIKRHGHFPRRRNSNHTSHSLGQPFMDNFVHGLANRKLLILHQGCHFSGHSVFNELLPTTGSRNSAHVVCVSASSHNWGVTCRKTNIFQVS